MRNTRILLTSAVFGLALNIATAAAPAGPAQGPEAPEPAPTFEIGKDGKLAHIDFSLTPKAISDPDMKLSHFSNRKLMIFYFSAQCPHCQHAIPYVQKLADELTAKGFTSIAISVKFNTEDDVRGFIRDYKVHMPVFQDQQQFGMNYGTGSIPLLFLVNERGEYIRYKTFDAEKTPEMIKAEAVLMSTHSVPANTTAAHTNAATAAHTKAAKAPGSNPPAEKSTKK
ncbi:MAG: TlpA disulfide reductase family protein [Fibrobacteria bacterium]